MSLFNYIFSLDHVILPSTSQALTMAHVGMYSSNVRAKVFNGTFEATVLAHNETYVIEHAERYDLGKQATHVIYRQSDIVSDLPSVQRPT